MQLGTVRAYGVLKSQADFLTDLHGIIIIFCLSNASRCMYEWKIYICHGLSLTLQLVVTEPGLLFFLSHYDSS